MSGAPLTGGMPPPDLQIDAALVRALLAAQHPDLAHLPVTPASEGWDNALFRMGDILCARLPRRAVAAPLAANEQRWLPILAPRLPLPVPAPLRVGAASADFPWPWSIVSWREGATADEAPPLDDEAPMLARFLRALHHEAPEDAPDNPVRGVPLSARADAMVQRLTNLAARGEPASAAVVRAWEDGLSAPRNEHPVWLHGDLHPRNVLVREGRLTAVIDWGDLCRGDPATDLAAVWLLFASRAARQRALDLYAPSEAAFRRARGWAATFAVILRDAGLTNNPPLARIAAVALARIADGP